MHVFIRAIALSAATGAVLATSACGSSKPVPLGTASPSASSSAPTYADYEGGLAAFEKIELAEAPIWASGKVTPAAQAQFEKDWFLPSIPLNNLGSYMEAHHTSTGVPVVITSKLLSSGTKDGYASLVAEQCVDASAMGSFIDGKPLKKVRPRYVRKITMGRPSGGTWRIRDLVVEAKAC